MSRFGSMAERVARAVVAWRSSGTSWRHVPGEAEYESAQGLPRGLAAELQRLLPAGEDVDEWTLSLGFECTGYYKPESEWGGRMEDAEEASWNDERTVTHASLVSPDGRTSVDVPRPLVKKVDFELADWLLEVPVEGTVDRDGNER